MARLLAVIRDNKKHRKTPNIFSMLSNYIKTTVRNLRRNKVNTLINITGLTVSIACCIVVYVFIKNEKTFDNFHSKASRTYRIVFDDKTGNNIEHGGYVSFPVAKALRIDFPQLENVTQVYVRNYGVIQIPSANDTRKLFDEQEITYADEYFFKTFDFQLLAGNKDNILKSPDEVVLTKRLADKFFGKEYADAYNRVIGKTIIINKKPYRISGVLKDMPRNSNIACNMLLPFKDFERNNAATMQNWIDTYSEHYVFVTLPENYTPQQFDKALIGFKNKHLPGEYAKRITWHPQLLTKVHTDEMYGGTYYATPSVLIIAFITMGIIVLLTACINFINLATVQSLKRAKEVGIRKTLGSRKYQLRLQFMIETFVLVLMASAFAVLLANWFLQQFNQYLLFIVDLGLHIDFSIILFLAILGLIITFFAGYYPAKVLSGYEPAKALKGGIQAKYTSFKSRFSLRKVLVVTQFVVTQLLIIGTIVVASQIKYFYSKDLGYDKTGVLNVEMPGNDEQKLELFRQTIVRNANVRDVSFSSGPPTSAGNGFGNIRLPEAPAADNITMERKFTDNNYLKTYKIQLLAGRDLWENDKVTLSDSAARYNILINNKAVTALGFASPEKAIGKNIIINDRDVATIVGVTKDFNNAALQNEVAPCVLFYGTNWVSTAGIRMNRINDAATNDFIQKAWEAVYPDNIYKSMPLDEYMHKKAFYVLEDIMYKGFKIFVVLSIIIGCMGLYGLIGFLAVQRQKEISIRKVLGASAKKIVYMFSIEFLWLIGIAFLVAAPLGYLAMTSWLQGFAYRINLSPVYFIAAFLISLLIATFTVSFQSIKAAVANPVKSLRNE